MILLTLKNGSSLMGVFICYFIFTITIPKIMFGQEQDHPNTITFDNKSGEVAMVKLIGPTQKVVTVPNLKQRTVTQIAAGNYYILIRFGTTPEEFTFSKGDTFSVIQTATQYSIITITLHKVEGGHYLTFPISKEEFEKAEMDSAIVNEE